MPLTTLLLADDSQLIRKTIASFLKYEPDIRLIAEAETFAQTVHLANALHPHVILMDVHMGDEAQIAASDCALRVNGARILAMSLWNDQETKTLAVALGAVVLLDKSKLFSELLPAIRKCATGDNGMTDPDKPKP